MQRLSLVFLASAGLLWAFCDAAAAQQLRRAERLLGGNENPPVITAGSGTFRARLFPDRIEFRLRYDVAAGNSDARQAHLHIANPGNNGNIVVFLCSDLGNTPAGATQRDCPDSPGIVEGEIMPDDVLEVTDGAVVVIEKRDLDGLKRLITQGAVYANVHSVDFPGGEVRGQLSPRIR